MKMSYEHRSNVNRRSVPLTIKIITILIAVLILVYTIFPKFLPSIVTAIVSPFWHSEDTSTVNSSLQSAVMSELIKQNNELKEMLNRNTSTTGLLLAYIVKKPPYTAYDSYIIDIGKKNQVAVGDKVYAQGNVLLGEIVEINLNYAKVKLYSSYNEKYEVLVGPKSIQATATGRGGGSFEVILPKESKIVENDIVMIPDLSPSVFGTVRSVSVDPARAFSTILFSQPINIYEQKWVEVHKKDSK
jgi:cell shape-determining protein MreC